MTTERLGADLACLEALCRPVTRDEFSKAMLYLTFGGQRLIAQVPGLPDPLEAYWHELKAYPNAVLRRAIGVVVRTHVWDTPIKPAEIIQAAEDDAEWQRIRAAKARVATARWRAEMAAKDEARMVERWNLRASPAVQGTPMRPKIKRILPDLSDHDLADRKARFIAECERLIRSSATAEAPSET